MPPILARSAPFASCPEIPADVIGTPAEALATSDSCWAAFVDLARTHGFRLQKFPRRDFPRVLGVERIAEDRLILPATIFDSGASRRKRARVMADEATRKVLASAHMRWARLFADQQGLCSLIGWPNAQDFDSAEALEELLETVQPFGLRCWIRAPFWFTGLRPSVLEIARPGRSILEHLPRGLESPDPHLLTGRD